MKTRAQILVDAILDAAATKRIVKTGYVRQAGGLYPGECDTVAGHSHAVAWPTILLAMELKDEFPLDLARVLAMVITHDHGEGRSGDTGSSSMAVFGTCKLHHLEREGLATSLKGWKAESYILELFDEYRAYSSAEALVVHAADMLEGFEKSLQRGHVQPWMIQDMLIPILADNLRIFRSREGALAPIGNKLAELILDTVAELFRRYHLEGDICSQVEAFIQKQMPTE